MSVNPQEAAALLLALDDASSSFLGFVRFMRPEWKVIPDFHLDLIDKLDRLERGTLTHPDGRPCYSMLINMPPRHSKSSIATELFPAYYILRDARRAVMSCAYNAELAADFGEKVRNYVTDPRALKAFPGFALSNLSKAKDFWRTQEGGQYAGVGIGGTTTGRPANCFVAGTMVATPNGPVPIERLSPGDTVLSFDHIANKIVPKTVVATQSSLSADLITTKCSTGTTITSTSDHKFFTPSGYRPAASLSIGEELVALEHAHVTGSIRIDNPVPATVYDIQVADTHNFFANGILVHNCLITDDPIKARDEAESATIRNKVWNYYVSALTTRKQPDVLDRPAIEIMILTRWHPDDPAGRIMETEEWKEGRWMHVCYAARTELIDPTAPTIPRNELPVTDPRYNPNDTTPVPKTRTFKPLWPSRFDLDFLSRREKLNPREFASLYQQQPYIEGGNIVKGYWWRYYTTPQDTYPHVIIACDTAYKKTTTSDYSVVAVMAMDLAGDIYLLDILRGRWDFPELKRLLTHQNAKWRGRGLRAIYVEDRASGQSLIQELKNQSGMSVIAFKTISDKVSRLHSVTPLIEGGRVYIPQTASWLDDFVQELTAFPSVQNDDQVDALSLGLDILSKIPINGLDSFDIAPITNSLNHTLASKNSLASQFKNKPLRFLGS